MSLSYQTEKGQHLHSEITSKLEGRISALQHGIPPSLFDHIRFIQDSTVEQISDTDPEPILNDRARLRSLFRFTSDYLEFWELLLSKSFKKSWGKLQDSLDELRFIKRHINASLPYFEHQLTGLELCYPYKLFASMGLAYGYTECSICTNDMDSDDCPHRAGELYNGQVAFGIVRDVISLDHVSLVTNPKDKRCIIDVKESAENFTIVDTVANWILESSITIPQIVGCSPEKRIIPNPDYKNLARNDKCFCKSGKKFKHCCSTKKTIEYEHLNINLTHPQKDLYMTL